MGLTVVTVASALITSLILTVRSAGWLQFLELLWYDRIVTLQPDQGLDPRLLIVEVTETDIRWLKRWPPADGTVAQVLRELQQYHPRAIGLDLVRDFPNEPGHQALRQQLRAPNVIAITSVDPHSADRVLPPPGMPEEQLGFVDLPLDSDNVVRRHLLFASDGNTDLTAFALQLALLYLEPLSIHPEAAEDGGYRLGRAIYHQLDSNAGAYQGADTAGYQIMLQARSPAQIAPRVTLTQVLTRRLRREQIQGKVVLIGVTAPSLKDLFFTSYSRTQTDNPQTAGVLIHAQNVSQILRTAIDGAPLLQFWPEWAEVSWILLWTIAGAASAWCTRHWLVSGLATGLLLSSLVGITYALFLRQVWIPLAAPALTFILAGAAVTLYQVQQAWHQQALVMYLLGQQTSPEIATALWNAREHLLNLGRLPWQRLTATIVFTDIRNFSSLAERTAPEQLMDWLNQYLSVMTDEVLQHHGIVNKFTGDGVMAVFGVPIAHTDPAAIARDAEQAVLCALAMRDRLQELNQKWQQQQGPHLQMRVGIYTGPVIVGSLGGKNRLEYGVIGDSVNIASRLESYAKERQENDCRILIAQETALYLQEHFQIEAWGGLQLRGRQQPVEVYYVIGKTSAQILKAS